MARTVTRQITVHIPTGLKDRLDREARERIVGPHWIVIRALEELFTRWDGAGDKASTLATTEPTRIGGLAIHEGETD